MRNTTHWVGTGRRPRRAEGAAFSNHTLRDDRGSVSGAVGCAHIEPVTGLARWRSAERGRACAAPVLAGSNRHLRRRRPRRRSPPVRWSSAIPSSSRSRRWQRRGTCRATCRTSFGITGRYAETNCISPPGDFAAAEVMPAGRLTDDWYLAVSRCCRAARNAPSWRWGIRSPTPTSRPMTAITVSQQLARRLSAPAGAGGHGGGDEPGARRGRTAHDVRAKAVWRRFDRDVAQPGVTHTLITWDSNDLRNRPGRPEEDSRPHR